MNTNITFQSYSDKSDNEIQEYYVKAYEQFEYVVKKYSRFDKNSELTKLNQNSGKPQLVTEELYNLVKFSLELANKTNGAFDPTVIDILEAYGYDPNYSFEKLDKRELVEEEIKELIKKRPKYSDIKYYKQKEGWYIHLKENQRIDLGGCGKGYAIDLAYLELEKGLDNFLIDAGGDIRVKGRDVGLESIEGWKIALFNPENTAKPLGHIVLNSKEAIACSGSWARKVKYFHHLIDMKSGKPKEGIKIVFAKANSAMVADAYSTSAYVMGKDIFKLDLGEVMIKIFEG